MVDGGGRMEHVTQSFILSRGYEFHFMHPKYVLHVEVVEVIIVDGQANFDTWNTCKSTPKANEHLIDDKQ